MKKFIIAILVIALLALGLYFITNSDPTPPIDIKHSGNEVAGYAVSNISYTFNTANPSNLTSVAFDLNNPAATAKVSLTTGGTLQDCTSQTPFTHWTCILTDTTVTNASSLRVVATQ